MEIILNSILPNWFNSNTNYNNRDNLIDKLSIVPNINLHIVNNNENILPNKKIQILVIDDFYFLKNMLSYRDYLDNTCIIICNNYNIHGYRFNHDKLKEMDFNIVFEREERYLISEKSKIKPVYFCRNIYILERK